MDRFSADEIRRQLIWEWIVRHVSPRTGLHRCFLLVRPRLRIRESYDLPRGTEPRQSDIDINSTRSHYLCRVASIGLMSPAPLNAVAACLIVSQGSLARSAISRSELSPSDMFRIHNRAI